MQSQKCRVCTEIKSLDMFHKNKGTSSGYLYQCKLCVKDYQKANKEKLKAYTAKHREENRERKRFTDNEWKKRNKETVKRQRRETAKRNLGTVYARNARHRAARINRLPVWQSDFERLVIKIVYDEARKMSDKGDVNYHVDHMIPMQGKLVSGLHCLSNLQIITATENLKKSNSYVAGGY